MPSTPASVIILEEALATRQRAARARHLAGSVTDCLTVERLERFANELETRAAELEQRARAVAATVERNRALSREIDEEIARAMARLETMQRKLGGAGESESVD